jgi:hypothetical protein
MCEASSYVQRWPIPFPMNCFPTLAVFHGVIACLVFTLGLGLMSGTTNLTFRD